MSSKASTPDIDFHNLITNTFDRRLHNIHYVCNVLRRFFGSHSKKSSINNSDDLQFPISIPSSLQFEHHRIFSGKNIHSFNSFFCEILGEFLFEWFLIHFEGRYENVNFIKQVILQCCTCLLGLDILRNETTPDNPIFEVCRLY